MSTMQSPVVQGHPCLSEDIVLAFQRGETTDSERQRIHRHIDTCEHCRQLLITTAAMEGGGSAPGVELDSMDRLAAVMCSGMRLTTFAEGKRLARRFDVTRFVDRGGMGEVYEAFDNVVGARVALKALLCTESGDEDVGSSRLGEEVNLARRVAHPNVCRIYDMHEHRESGHQPLRFLAMEFVDGVTLKERLLAAAMSIDEACSLARQLLMGLGAVHAAGVLHLDFKSQNVMLREGKTPAQPVVMDFSLSRAFEKELRLRTSERRVAGSIGYMSPEQLECRSTIGPAADVYAFGVVLYEMLTGKMPFQGDSPAAIMLKQLRSRAAPPSQLRPGISPALDAFVGTCLSRHARGRFQTVASAVEAFDACQQAEPERRWSPRAWLGTVGVAVLAAAGAGGVVHLAWRMAPPEAAAEVAASTDNDVASTPAIPLPPAPVEHAAEPAREAPEPERAEPSPKASRSVHAVRPTPLPRLGAGPAKRRPPVEGAASNAPGLAVPPPAASARPAVEPRAEPASEMAPQQKAPQEKWVPTHAPDFLL